MLRVARMIFYVPSKQLFDKFARASLESASECLFEGSICYLDNAQIEAVAFEMVLPLQ